MLNSGRAVGPVGEVLHGCRYEPGLLRPYLVSRGGRNIPTVTINVSRDPNKSKYKAYPIEALQRRGIQSPVFNATSLRKEEWLQLDQVVLRAARFRLRAWADLAAANSYGGFNGMSKMILEHETMSDPGEAIVDMDALTEGRADAPKFQLEGLPLPITHSDFWFSARRLAVSRNTGTPLDTTMGESAGRRVAELIEKTTIGVSTGITYGGNSTQVGGYGRTPSVYGYINFPNRLTYAGLRIPTGASWTPAQTLADVLYLRQLMYFNKFYGPYMLYHSNDWDQYMDNDYIVSAGAGNVSGLSMKTLRERLRAIEGITDVRRLDFLFGTAVETNQAAASGVNATTGMPTGYRGPGGDIDVSIQPYRLILVQMTPDCARAVNGMDITTVQWESMGGMRVNFKVMTIQVPQLRADIYGNCGILDAVPTGETP